MDLAEIGRNHPRSKDWIIYHSHLEFLPYDNLYHFVPSYLNMSNIWCALHSTMCLFSFVGLCSLCKTLRTSPSLSLGSKTSLKCLTTPTTTQLLKHDFKTKFWTRSAVVALSLAPQSWVWDFCPHYLCSIIKMVAKYYSAVINAPTSFKGRFCKTLETLWRNIHVLTFFPKGAWQNQYHCQARAQ